jgi:ATP-dependent helicase/nuclease subunit A
MRPNEVPIDQKQRNLASEDLSQSYLVEAAAGTGKTTVLVKRILNLIRKGEARLEEVVAITFTEKAAAELKVKLRQELERALFEESNPDDHQRISEALSDLERMQVTTIHSFCGSLLRERPIEANLDPNFEVADNLLARLLQREVWERWFERQMDGNHPGLRRAVLMGLKADQLYNIARSLIENREISEYLPAPQPLEELEKAINQFIEILKEEIASLNSLKSYCKNEKDNAFLAIEELALKLKKLESISDREERERFIFKAFSIDSKIKGSKKNWNPESPLLKVREHIDSIRRNLKEIKGAIEDSIVKGLIECLTGFLDAYQQAKRERNLLDFQDLLLFTKELFRQHPEVRRYFRGRYRFLLVDEFQDTDPLQTEIVFFLSEEERSEASEWREVRVANRRLFLVGDPKQSIYRFRRADIEMYEEAKVRMGERRLLTISQNFRCAPSIMGWVNRIFQDLIKPPEDGLYQPEYVPLHFGRKKETVPPIHGTILLYPPKKEGIRMTHVNECRHWESRCIASFIQRWVSEERWLVWDEMGQSFRPMRFKDIAILMRAHTPVPFLEEALRSYGVNYRVVGGRHFYQRQEIQQLLNVLQAVNDPNDKVALIGALRSPFFGVSDEEIFLFHARGGELNYLHDASETILKEPFQFLRELHQIRNQVSVSALLKRLYEATRAPVLFLMKPQGEQRVANLLKIEDVAQALEERGRISFRGFVRWLSERQEEEDEEEEAPTLEQGDDFVRLMTIHKAKGLEFPVVILADLGHGKNEHENVIIDRSGRRIGLKIGDKENRIQTLNFDELKQWEEKRGEAEEKRLLYVGMTRARDFLVLPVFWVKEKNDGRKEIPDKSFLKYLQPYLVEPEHIPYGKWDQGMMFYDTHRLNLIPEEQEPFQYPLSFDKESEEEIRLSLSQFERWKEAQGEIRRWGEKGRAITTAIEEIEEVQREEEWAIPPGTSDKGAIFGKLVHRVFEKMDWNQPRFIKEITEREGRMLGATGPMIQRAEEMVRQAIRSPILQRVMQSRNYYKEVPFTYKKNGILYEGVMDVVFREGEDLIVLDFKTDLVDQKNLNSKIKHYQPQIEIYSDAIQSLFGTPPKEVILFFLHLMEAVSIGSTKGE